MLVITYAGRSSDSSYFTRSRRRITRSSGKGSLAGQSSSVRGIHSILPSAAMTFSSYLSGSLSRSITIRLELTAFSMRSWKLLCSLSRLPKSKSSRTLKVLSGGRGRVVRGKFNSTRCPLSVK